MVCRGVVVHHDGVVVEVVAVDQDILDEAPLVSTVVLGVVSNAMGVVSEATCLVSFHDHGSSHLTP